MIDEKVKVEIVKFIRERAPTLFGPLSEKVTNEARREKWIEVWNYCREIGQFVQPAVNAAKKKGGSGHEWEYIRASVWGQWAKAVCVCFQFWLAILNILLQTKADNARHKTGSARGPDWMESEKMIVEILGPEVLHGIDDENEHDEQKLHVLDDDSDDDHMEQSDDGHLEASASSTGQPPKSKKARLSLDSQLKLAKLEYYREQTALSKSKQEKLAAETALLKAKAEKYKTKTAILKKVN